MQLNRFSKSLFKAYLSSNIDAAQLRLVPPIAEAPVVSSDALCSPAIYVASELVGLAVAAHRASAGHSSAFFGLIALHSAFRLQLSFERSPIILSTPPHPAVWILGCSNSVAVWLGPQVLRPDASALGQHDSLRHVWQKL